MICMTCTEQIEENEPVLVAFKTPNFNDAAFTGEIYHRKCVDGIPPSKEDNNETKPIRHSLW